MRTGMRSRSPRRYPRKLSFSCGAGPRRRTVCRRSPPSSLPQNQRQRSRRTGKLSPSRCPQATMMVVLRQEYHEQRNEALHGHRCAAGPGVLPRRSRALQFLRVARRRPSSSGVQHRAGEVPCLHVAFTVVAAYVASAACGGRPRRGRRPRLEYLLEETRRTWARPAATAL